MDAELERLASVRIDANNALSDADAALRSMYRRDAEGEHVPLAEVRAAEAARREAQEAADNARLDESVRLTELRREAEDADREAEDSPAGHRWRVQSGARPHAPPLHRPGFRGYQGGRQLRKPRNWGD